MKSNSSNKIIVYVIVIMVYVYTCLSSKVCKKEGSKEKRSVNNIRVTIDTCIVVTTIIVGVYLYTIPVVLTKWWIILFAICTHL